tara:strand:- start:78 stop:461 length:384 start_codon:yes stop_codon:yes gene_type:complete
MSVQTGSRKQCLNSYFTISKATTRKAVLDKYFTGLPLPPYTNCVLLLSTDASRFGSRALTERQRPSAPQVQRASLGVSHYISRVAASCDRPPLLSLSIAVVDIAVGVVGFFVVVVRVLVVLVVLGWG